MTDHEVVWGNPGRGALLCSASPGASCRRGVEQCVVAEWINAEGPDRLYFGHRHLLTDGDVEISWDGGDFVWWYEDEAARVIDVRLDRIDVGTMDVQALADRVMATLDEVEAGLSDLPGRVKP